MCEDKFQCTTKLNKQCYGSLKRFQMFLQSHIKVLYLSPFQLYKITSGGKKTPHVYSIYKYPSNVVKVSETDWKILEPLWTALFMRRCRCLILGHPGTRLESVSSADGLFTKLPLSKAASCCMSFRHSPYWSCHQAFLVLLRLQGQIFFFHFFSLQFDLFPVRIILQQLL